MKAFFEGNDDLAPLRRFPSDANKLNEHLARLTENNAISPPKSAERHQK